MADNLYDLLTQPGSAPSKTAADPSELDYITSWSGRSLSSLAADEPQALSQTSHGLLLSLQALSKKSHKDIIASAAHHASLHTSLPALAASAADLRAFIPKLDAEAVRFFTTYNKSSEHAVLVRRKRALLLSRNVERLVDVLELPTLLATAISSAPVNYASALDLNGYIRCLHALYPTSPLLASIAAQADDAMRLMASNLLLSLQSPSLKLATSLRTERVLGALFLVCRLATLTTTLDALNPLRYLADQKRARQRALGSGNAWSGGQQTERFLKRYLEIFREQSFAIVSIYKSIFPAASTTGDDGDDDDDEDPLEPIPSALATFPLYLVDMLLETLRALGRLGGDFGLFLATLDVGGEAEEEWVEVVKRHRALAGRLESMVGEQRKGS
ncbi:Dor1-like family-domain-containing protein [Lasiosphaeria hispida]|uniref:Conserved oligomeric Golgi complex subunit 8 n=1 Tax=Lasiosphaeria hispida TaxID=260671 RepID=A0AAJ0MKJ6_9PEZI|nr:Dor1-like family-domain-containing protein [Lasiosphaeria hispida]